MRLRGCMRVLCIRSSFTACSHTYPTVPRVWGTRKLVCPSLAPSRSGPGLYVYLSIGHPDMKRVRRLKQVFVVGVALGFALQSIIINPRAPKRGGYMTVVQPLTFFYKTKLGSLFVFAAPSLPGSRRPPSLLSPTHAMLASALATGLPSSGGVVFCR